METDTYYNVDLRITKDNIGRISVDELTKGKGKTLRIAVQNSEDTLDFSFGQRLLELVNNLEKKGFTTEITSPIFFCQLGMQYTDFIKKHKITDSCLYCSELYHIDAKSELISCETLGNINLGSSSLIRNRAQLWCYLSLLFTYAVVSTKCQSCRYYLSKRCRGLKFFKIL